MENTTYAVDNAIADREAQLDKAVDEHNEVQGCNAPSDQDPDAGAADADTGDPSESGQDAHEGESS